MPKAIRPSFLINFYLVITVILDAARVRTQWLARYNDAIAGTLGRFLGRQVRDARSGSRGKAISALKAKQTTSLESTSGLISRGHFLVAEQPFAEGIQIYTDDRRPPGHPREARFGAFGPPTMSIVGEGRVTIEGWRSFLSLTLPSQPLQEACIGSGMHLQLTV